MNDIHYIPEGLPALAPTIIVKEASRAIEWYKKVFGAQELNRVADPDGRIVHAEIRISGCMLMLSEENAPHNKSPKMLNGTSVVLNLYVPDVDRLEKTAVREGAVSIFPVEDQFYGDRAGRIQDPFGHMWIISKHIRNVTAEEMQRKMSGNLN